MLSLFPLEKAALQPEYTTSGCYDPKMTNQKKFYYIFAYLKSPRDRLRTHSMKHYPRRGKSVAIDASASMATDFPGVSSERRQKSPRLPEGNVTESFCAESIEWKSRSRDSGVGAGTKLVLRNGSGGRRARPLSMVASAEMCQGC